MTPEQIRRCRDGMRLTQPGFGQRIGVGRMTENAEVSGVVVSGFARAEAVVKNSTKLKDQRRAKKQERDANHADALEALTRTAELQKLGTIEVSEEADVPDGLWLSFTRGSPYWHHSRSNQRTYAGLSSSTTRRVEEPSASNLTKA